MKVSKQWRKYCGKQDCNCKPYRKCIEDWLDRNCYYKRDVHKAINETFPKCGKSYECKKCPYNEDCDEWNYKKKLKNNLFPKEK